MYDIVLFIYDFVSKFFSSIALLRIGFKKSEKENPSFRVYSLMKGSWLKFLFNYLLLKKQALPFHQLYTEGNMQVQIGIP